MKTVNLHNPPKNLQLWQIQTYPYLEKNTQPKDDIEIKNRKADHIQRILNKTNNWLLIINYRGYTAKLLQSCMTL